MLPGMATIGFPLFVGPDDIPSFATEPKDVAAAKFGDDAAL